MATQLGLRAKIGLLRRARSLHLHFDDTSSLWITRSGTGLAGPAPENTAAHSFAKAHAKKVGWERLTERADWLIPQPEKAGDWLAAPQQNVAAIQDQIWRAATLKRLTGSLLDLDDIRTRFLAPEPHPALVSPLPIAQHHVVLVSKTCIALDPDSLARQISDLTELAEGDPDLMVITSETSFHSFTISSPATLLRHLQNRLADLQQDLQAELFAQDLPATPQEDEGLEVSDSDEEMDMGMEP